MREEFEKLPEIARVIACDEIKWCDTYHWYRTDNTDANSIYHVAWLNGAWYAFQEQKKKIDKALALIDENRDILGTAHPTMDYLIEDIEDLLK